MEPDPIPDVDGCDLMPEDWAAPVPREPATYRIADEEETVLQVAQRLISGERAAEYGSAAAESAKVARGWSAIFGVEVQPEHVWLAMCWLKIVREAQRHKDDNLVDLAGYAGLVEKTRRGL